MVVDGDGTAGSGRLANGDVLVEGRGSLDGRLVDLLVLPDCVGRTITGHCAPLRATCADANVCLHDIVLYQRVGSPAIDTETSKAAVDTESSTVCNGCVTTRAPTNTHDKVLLGVPVQAEAVRSRGEVDTATSPVVLLVVGVGSRFNGRPNSANAEVSEALRQRVVVSHDEVHRATLLQRRRRCRRRGKGQSCGTEAERDIGEGNHGSSR